MPEDKIKHVLHEQNITLKEAKFYQDEDPTTKAKRDIIEVTAIKSGWSKNGNYYSKEVAESLAPFLLEKRKIYLNHLSEAGNANVMGGRDLNDWVGIVIEAWGDGGTTKAKIEIIRNKQNTSWIYEVASRFPDEVQLSIDAKAYVAEGEKEGKSGYIVKEFERLISLDIVPYASAGGVVNRIAAMEFNEDDEDDIVIGKITEIIKNKPKEMIEKLISEISKTEYEDQEYPAKAYIYTPDKDRPVTWRYRVMRMKNGGLKYDNDYIVRALRNFYWDSYDGILIPDKEVKSLKKKFIKVLKAIGVDENDIPKSLKENESINIEELEDFYEIIKKENLVTNKDNNNTKSTEVTDVEIKELTIEDLISNRTDLVEALKEGWKKELSEKAEIKKKDEQIKELEKKNAKLTEEKQDLEKKVDDYQLKEKLEEKKKVIEQKLKDSKLEEDHISDNLKSNLKKAKDEDEMDEIIKDREDLVESISGKVKDNGESKDKTKTTEGEDQKALTTKDLKKALGK